MLPAKFAWSVLPLPVSPLSCMSAAFRFAPPAVAAAALFDVGHLLVILIRFEKNSTAASPVMSRSPYLLRVPYNPPNENGSRGTGMPMLTPSIAARNRLANHSALPPFVVYTDAAFPNGLAGGG